MIAETGGLGFQHFTDGIKGFSIPFSGIWPRKAFWGNLKVHSLTFPLKLSASSHGLHRRTVCSVRKETEQTPSTHEDRERD